MHAHILVFNAVTINATATADSEIIDLLDWDGSAMAAEFLLSGTAPHVKLEYLVSQTKEGTFREPSGASDIVADATASDVKPLTPEKANYMKIRYTGLATNGVDTVLTLRLSFGEARL